MPFGTLNAAADEIRDQCNNVKKVNLMFKQTSFDGCILMLTCRKKNFPLKAPLLMHQMEQQCDVLTRSGRLVIPEEKQCE